MHEHGSLPRARHDGLVEEAVGDELLLYDQNSHIAHCLSPIAASVWQHCDGERDVTQLAKLAGANEDLVADALHELREKELLDAEPQLMHSAALGVSRREAISRIARYGAAAAGVPLIVSAAAATPAMASSAGCISTTNKGDTCCLCSNGCFVNIKSEAECETKCRATGGEKEIFFPTEKTCK
jgi:hypothetical protein